MRGAAGTRTSFEVLLCRAGVHYCALPLTAVSETMRRLEVRAIAPCPAFVEGLTLVRGVAMPLVNLARLLGQLESAPAVRFVHVTTGSRSVAVGVDEVVGVRLIEVGSASDFPPLLGGVREQFVDALTTLDRELLLVLSSARLLPESTWDSLLVGEATGQR
jgi:purine-binding chemotaxis protein CheW